jgi:hypothetical protein
MFEWKSGVMADKRSSQVVLYSGPNEKQCRPHPSELTKQVFIMRLLPPIYKPKRGNSVHPNSTDPTVGSQPNLSPRAKTAYRMGSFVSDASRRLSETNKLAE